jgi:hypothetical protein
MQGTQEFDSGHRWALLQAGRGVVRRQVPAASPDNACHWNAVDASDIAGAQIRAKRGEAAWCRVKAA